MKKILWILCFSLGLSGVYAQKPSMDPISVNPSSNVLGVIYTGLTFEKGSSSASIPVTLPLGTIVTDAQCPYGVVQCFGDNRVLIVIYRSHLLCDAEDIEDGTIPLMPIPVEIYTTKKNAFGSSCCYFVNLCWNPQNVLGH